MPQPSSTSLGRDDNGNPFTGGVDTSGNTRVLEMVPGSSDGLGIPRVQVEGSIEATTTDSPPTLLDANQKLLTNGVPVPLKPTAFPCKTILVAHDDGALPNGASKVIWLGTSSVAPGVGIPLRPGGSFSMDIEDANELYLVAEGDDQTISYMITG